METYKTITLVQASQLSLEYLVRDYNDAIETIWYLQQQLHEQKKENDALWAAYEEIADKLYR